MAISKFTQKSSKLGNWLYALLVLSCIGVFSYSQYWNKKQVIQWDVTIYYAYLPALFIYDDLHFENISTPEWSQRQFYQNTDTAGNNYLKMTCGLAMLYSPFFAGAHWYASQSPNYLADGFSAPYRFALLLSALFFTLWALHLLRLVLRQFFSDGVAMFTVLLIFTGTNLPYYTFVEPMTHAYNFFLVCLILWGFMHFMQRPRYSLAALIGGATGLLTLIRPTDILVLFFIVLFWALSRRRPALKSLWPHLLLAAVLGILVISPQFFYWHYATGHWLVYSYNDESFFFTDPEIWKGYFSYRKGWFVYSPILFVALPGFILLARHQLQLFWGALLTVFVASWVTFSWWCWWYGGGFGARPMIEFLPFMAMALAASLAWLTQQKKMLKIPAIVLMSFIAVWSVFMNKQYKSQIFHWDSMSKEVYWGQFFKDHIIENYQQKLDPPDYEAAKRNENVN